MRIIPDRDINAILENLNPSELNNLLAVLSDGLARYSAENSVSTNESKTPKSIHQPLRTQFMTTHETTHVFMPVSDSETTCIKCVSLAQGDPLKVIVNIFDQKGKLLALLGAEELTAFRTALATMTVLTRCSQQSKRNIVVFGSGKQAKWHLLLILGFFSDTVEEIVVFNRSRKRLDEMLREIQPVIQRKFPAHSLRLSAEEDAEDKDAYQALVKQKLSLSDVIMCCVPSTEPLFPYSYLLSDDNKLEKPKFISLIGSYKPHMQEIDSETLLSGQDGKVLVDSVEACLEESGEIIRAGLPKERLMEIGTLFQGHDQKIISNANIVYKCVGFGIMDLVISGALLRLAEEQGIGVKVDQW